MPAGTVIKHKRKAGAFVSGELAAGEWGLDVTNSNWYYSINGTTVVVLASGGVNTANAPLANEFARFTGASTIEGRTVVETKTDLNLENVTNTSDANKPVSAAQQTALDLKSNNASPTFTGIPAAPTAAPGTNTTQIATSAFVAAAVSVAVSGLLEMMGNIDASANPNYPAANKGDTYYISVAGKIGGAAGVTVAIGDAVIAKADNVGGTEASVGTSWFVLEKNLAGALLSANNLSDVADTATARTNLGAAPLSHTHAADDITSGDLATARMQTNVAAAVNASSAATINNASITIDGGTL